jgi:hypothetical protein
MSKWEDPFAWEIYLLLYDGWRVHAPLFTEYRKYRWSFLPITV